MKRGNQLAPSFFVYFLAIKCAVFEKEEEEKTQ
jgi:hypothetical protein